MRSTTPSWVASSASSSRPPPATSGDGAPRARRRPRRPPPRPRPARVGVRGGGRAAQDDRVAGLQAQRGGVDRDVRPGLVDDRDDAERHALPCARRRPLGSREPSTTSPTGSGSAAIWRTPVADRRHAARVERQAVQQRRRQARSRARPPGRARWPRGSRARGPRARRRSRAARRPSWPCRARPGRATASRAGGRRPATDGVVMAMPRGYAQRRASAAPQRRGDVARRPLAGAHGAVHVALPAAPPSRCRRSGSRPTGPARARARTG